MNKKFSLLAIFLLLFAASTSNATQLRVSVEKRYVLVDGTATRVVKNLDVKSQTVLLPMTPEADAAISVLESGNYTCNVNVGSNLVITYGTWLQPAFSITDCK